MTKLDQANYIIVVRLTKQQAVVIGEVVEIWKTKNSVNFRCDSDYLCSSYTPLFLGRNNNM